MIVFPGDHSSTDLMTRHTWTWRSRSPQSGWMVAHSYRDSGAARMEKCSDSPMEEWPVTRPQLRRTPSTNVKRSKDALWSP